MSYTEILSENGRTRIKSQRTRCADGKPTRERFDGERHGGAFEQLAALAQRQFAAQRSPLLRTLRWLLPGTTKRSGDRD